MLIRLVIIIALSALAACAPHQPVDTADREQFRSQLQAALLDNPDMVLDLLREHDIEAYDIVTRGADHKRRREEAERLAHELANPLTPAITPERPMRGAPDAPVTIVSYSDFLCSWCARGAQTVAQLMENRPGQVRLIFKHVPRSETSTLAALYYEALGEQNPELAFALHDRLFDMPERLGEEGAELLRSLALELGADMARLDADLERDDLKERISADVREAEGFEFAGTPMYVVGGVSLRGAQPLEEFDKIVRLVLEHAAAQ